MLFARIIRQEPTTVVSRNLGRNQHLLKTTPKNANTNENNIGGNPNDCQRKAQRIVLGKNAVERRRHENGNDVRKTRIQLVVAAAAAAARIATDKKGGDDDDEGNKNSAVWRSIAVLGKG